jgi:hypothetical protein
MNQFRLALSILLLVPLAACIIPLPVPEGTPGAFEIVLDEGDLCGARRLQDYVGQPEAAVRAMRFDSPVPVRIVSPGTPATGPVDPSRLNFVVNAAGLVETVGCG